jgi:hypothetical protein
MPKPKNYYLRHGAPFSSDCPQVAQLVVRCPAAGRHKSVMVVGFFSRGRTEPAPPSNQVRVCKFMISVLENVD